MKESNLNHANRTANKQPHKRFMPVVFSLIFCTLTIQLLYFKKEMNIVEFEIKMAAMLLATVYWYVRGTRVRTGFLYTGVLLLGVILISVVLPPLPEHQKWILSWMTTFALVPAQAAVFSIPFGWICQSYVRYFTPQKNN